MKNKIALFGFAGSFCATALLMLLQSVAIAEPFQPVTVADSSFTTAAGGDNDSSMPVISADGRYVLFASTANNLALAGTNSPLPVLSPAKQNVFLRDRLNGTTTLVSVNLAGIGGGNSDSLPTGISTNGQFALFESASTNLVTGATNSLMHVYRRDLVNDITALANADLLTASYGEARSSVLTRTGRYAAYASFNSQAKSITDVFVRDMQSNTTTQLSNGANGATPGSSDLPDITPDGHYVAFYSAATNVVPGVRSANEIYIRDLIAGTTTLASGFAHTAVSNIFGTTNSISFNHCVSDDGQFVAYEAGTSTKNGIILRYSASSGLTDVISTNGAGQTGGTLLSIHSLDMSADGGFVAYVQSNNANSCIMVWDAQSGTSTLASGDTNNSIPAGECSYPALDASGRYVSFVFNGVTSLTTNSVSSGPHLYVRDLQTGTTSLVDVDTNGVGSSSNPATYPRISASGGFIAYEAYGGGLVPNGTNQYSDVFVYSITNNSTELISVHRPELPSTGLSGPSSLTLYSASSDGRYLAFTTGGTNVVPNLTNNTRNVIVRDILNGSNTLVSVDSNGVVSAVGASYEAAIGSNGRYVSFTSVATNLTAGLFINTPNVFARDLQTGVTMLVSVSTNGVSGNAQSTASIISADGRRVFFHSMANNIAGGVSTTNIDNLYFRDVQNGSTVLLLTNGSIAWNADGAMTPDGHYCVVAGTNVNLLVWDLQATNKVYTNTAAKSALASGISPDGTHIGAMVSIGVTLQVYALDRVSNTTTMIATSSIPFKPSVREGFRFSSDSRYMAYVAPDTAKTNQIFVYDFQTGSNALVSRNFTATVSATGNGNSDSPDISADGRFVAYRSLASNLVVGVTNTWPNIYLYDRITGITTLATVSQAGNFAAAARSLIPVFSGDGHTLFVNTWAQDVSAQGFSPSAGIFALSLVTTNSQAPFPVTVQSGVPGQFTITWPAISAKTYQVQYKANLTDALWSVLTGDITVLGNQATITDYAAPTQRYYRVVAF